MNWFSAAVVGFLRRPGSLKTWRYERCVHLAVEVLCLAAGVLVLPAGPARWCAVILAPLALWQAELTRAAASVETRRVEEDARLGVERAVLNCDPVVRRQNEARQIVGWAWPALASVLPALVVGAVLWPALAGLGVTVVRMVRDRVAYPAWRRWWVEARR